MFQAAGAVVRAPGQITPIWPAHATNDIALLIVGSLSQEPASLATPAGFVQVANSPQKGADGTTRLSVFWCRASSAAQQNPVVADSGQYNSAVILTYRNCVITGNPWDITAGGNTASPQAGVSFPSVNTTVPNTLIVNIGSDNLALAGQRISGFANGALAGLSERLDDGYQGTYSDGLWACDGQLSVAGNSGATTANLAGAATQAHLTIALK